MAEMMRWMPEGGRTMEYNKDSGTGRRAVPRVSLRGPQARLRRVHPLTARPIGLKARGSETPQDLPISESKIWLPGALRLQLYRSVKESCKVRDWIPLGVVAVSTIC